MSVNVAPDTAKAPKLAVALRDADPRRIVLKVTERAKTACPTGASMR